MTFTTPKRPEGRYRVKVLHDSLTIKELSRTACKFNKMLGTQAMLTPDEQSQIKEWNSTKANYPSHKTIHQVFEEQVNRSPEALALVMPSLTDGSAQHLTYHELDCHSQQLAFQLQQLGVGSETLVAIVTERTIEMIVAILAILKAGGVYVPIDPSYPADRIAFMLEDTQAAVLLTQADLSKRLPQHQSKLILLDNICAQLNSIEKPELNCSNPVNALNLAYINYTSGSTGRPKGVSIPHQAILRLLFGTSFTPLDQDRVFLQLAPISFDAATLEVGGLYYTAAVAFFFLEMEFPILMI